MNADYVGFIYIYLCFLFSLKWKLLFLLSFNQILLQQAYWFCSKTFILTLFIAHWNLKLSVSLCISAWIPRNKFWHEIVIFLQVSPKTSQINMTPVIRGFAWQSYNEETASSDSGDSTSLNGLWEQISITRDASDYLWYMTE